jgi:hypothetical protein
MTDFTKTHLTQIEVILPIFMLVTFLVVALILYSKFTANTLSGSVREFVKLRLHQRDINGIKKSLKKESSCNCGKEETPDTNGRHNFDFSKFKKTDEGCDTGCCDC